MRLLHLVHELELELDRRVDPLLRLFEALGDHLFGDLRRAGLVHVPRLLGATGLDHHDRDVAVGEAAAGDDELERRLVALLERGVRDPLALVVRETHRADRAVERDARDHERRRRAVDRRDVVRVLLVGAHDRGDHLDLVAEPGRERRPQRAVGEAAGEDRELTGAALTTEERAGDLSRGVHPLLDVDGEGEEVDALAGLAGTHGREQGRATDLHQDGAVGELGETPGLERHLEARGIDGAGYVNGVAHGSGSSVVVQGEDRFPVVIVRAVGPGGGD